MLEGFVSVINCVHISRPANEELVHKAFMQSQNTELALDPVTGWVQ